jgi:hypothetical protein
MQQKATARAAVLEKAPSEASRTARPPSNFLTFHFLADPGQAPIVKLQARKGSSLREAMLHWLDTEAPAVP